MYGTNGSSDHQAGLADRTREEAQYFWSDAAAVRQELQELAGLELDLLRAEMAEQARFAQRTALFGAIAAILGLLMMAFAFVALMYGLAEFMETWTAALITAGVITVLTALFGLFAYQYARRLSVTPKRTINSLKEDAQWARDLLTSNRT